MQPTNSQKKVSLTVEGGIGKRRKKMPVTTREDVSEERGGSSGSDFSSEAGEGSLTMSAFYKKRRRVKNRRDRKVLLGTKDQREIRRQEIYRGTSKRKNRGGNPFSNLERRLSTCRLSFRKHEGRGDFNRNPQQKTRAFTFVQDVCNRVR